MTLKFIIIASFGLTGTLFYLSKQSPSELKTPARTMAEPELVPPPAVSRKAAPRILPSQPLVPAENPKYAALLPIGDQVQPATKRQREPRDDFYATYVQPTVRACFNKLVERRKMIYKEREGDAELSFDGELQIIATFNQNQLESLRSRSSEVRDDTFHNCIESDARGWKFPESIVSQGQWTYKQRIAFDVNYLYDCKDSSVRLRGSDAGPMIGTGKCL